MADASYLVPHFLGGEISQFAQGRVDRPDYKVSLNVCLNAFPVEIGPWVRRPGTRNAGHTRGGAAGRVMGFDFEQAQPYTMEFTNGYLRFRSGATIVSTNDPATVSSISAATPAVVQTATAHGWSTGNTVVAPSPAPSPLLENRQFTITVTDSTHFSLQDALTGANIDGSALGTIGAGTFKRVQEIVTTYVNNSWASLRAVQAETSSILLCSTIAPQAVTVTSLPGVAADAIFDLGAATLIDGPYLNPFTNGVQVTPSAKSGNITLALSFPAYSSTQAYAKDAFVTSSSVNYQSLTDNNVNNTPASSPSDWVAASAGQAIGPNGFVGTDVGRLVRLFSEPLPWASGTTYSVGNVVAYNPSNVPGDTTYWTALASTTGNIPGTDTTHWTLTPANAALWSWGKITSLSNQIAQSGGGIAHIGDLNEFAGVAAAFDGNSSKTETNCAGVNTLQPTYSYTLQRYIGQDYSTLGAQRVASATVYPSIDGGFVQGRFFYDGGAAEGDSTTSTQITFNLWASHTPPANSSDGTLLGSSGVLVNPQAPVNVTSSDNATAWGYVWVETLTNNTVGPVIGGTPTTGVQVLTFISQLFIYSSVGTGVSSGINVELLGPPLLYTTAIRTWRIGAYSNTTGWPTCGCYDDGRLWLGGAISNRFDACVSNGIINGTINFAPTDQTGAVATSNAISYTFNADGVNPIFWMEPNLQGISMGTQAGEWLVQAPTNGGFAPNNIAARRVTKIGCANILPCRTEHTTVFVQRYTLKLPEYFPDVFSGKFSAPNLADKMQHITRAGIAELAYTNAAEPIIWGRDTLGALFGITYKRDSLASAQPPAYYAGHRHALGSGRAIESICAGPSLGGDLDTLTMVTNDSTNIRHVEILTDTMDELSPLIDAWFLDNAVAPSSTSTSTTPVAGAPYGGMTLNGLWHLNGKTVQVFAGGLDCGDRGTGSTGYTDFVVANGSVFVPFGDDVNAGCGQGLFTADYVASFPSGIPIVVGFTYNSDGQVVRPIAQADTGARNGPAFAKLGRGHRIGVKLVNTKGISFGTDFSKMYPANFKLANGVAIPTTSMFSGIFQDTLQDDYSYDRALCWRVSRPYPANVVAIGSNLATQDQ